MFVNLTDVFRDEDKTVTMQIEPETEQVMIGGETFPVTGKKPLHLILSNVGKGEARITGSGEITFLVRCSRCLKEVEETLEFQFDRTVFAPDRMASAEESDDQGYMNGYQMDVEDLLYNEIVINWPMKVLCREDCKGICNRCGANLNHGDCGCDRTEPDPRMAAIRDIFKNASQ